MRINAGAIGALLTHCLQTPEDKSKPLSIPGVLNTFVFNRERLEGGREIVKQWLAQLPPQFHHSTGGGWSFLQACFDKDGRQWGEHADIERLMCLGLGLGLVDYLMPDREIWAAMPGGMPYFVVKV